MPASLKDTVLKLSYPVPATALRDLQKHKNDDDYKTVVTVLECLIHQKDSIKHPPVKINFIRGERNEGDSIIQRAKCFITQIQNQSIAAHLTILANNCIMELLKGFFRQIKEKIKYPIVAEFTKNALYRPLETLDPNITQIIQNIHNVLFCLSDGNTVNEVLPSTKALILNLHSDLLDDFGDEIKAEFTSVKQQLLITIERYETEAVNLCLSLIDDRAQALGCNTSSVNPINMILHTPEKGEIPHAVSILMTGLPDFSRVQFVLDTLSDEKKHAQFREISQKIAAIENSSMRSKLEVIYKKFRDDAFAQYLEHLKADQLPQPFFFISDEEDYLNSFKLLTVLQDRTQLDSQFQSCLNLLNKIRHKKLKNKLHEFLQNLKPEFFNHFCDIFTSNIPNAPPPVVLDQIEKKIQSDQRFVLLKEEDDYKHTLTFIQLLLSPPIDFKAMLEKELSAITNIIIRGFLEKIIASLEGWFKDLEAQFSNAIQLIHRDHLYNIKTILNNTDFKYIIFRSYYQTTAGIIKLLQERPDYWFSTDNYLDECRKRASILPSDQQLHLLALIERCAPVPFEANVENVNPDPIVLSNAPGSSSAMSPPNPVVSSAQKKMELIRSGLESMKVALDKNIESYQKYVRFFGKFGVVKQVKCIHASLKFIISGLDQECNSEKLTDYLDFLIGLTEERLAVHYSFFNLAQRSEQTKAFYRNLNQELKSLRNRILSPDEIPNQAVALMSN